MMQWITLCKLDDLIDNSGVCAYLPDIEGQGRQLALFSLRHGDKQQLFAVGNWDPIGKANVISRGIVGSIAGEPVVASPLYKQHFSLLSGQCLEDNNIALPVFAVRLSGQDVQIANPSQPVTKGVC
ncbi:nitrite reductase small subunit NirD [Bowmanella denitrificans]